MTVEQLVLPAKCRGAVLQLAHAIPITGHLGKTKIAPSPAILLAHTVRRCGGVLPSVPRVSKGLARAETSSPSYTITHHGRAVSDA